MVYNIKIKKLGEVDREGLSRKKKKRKKEGLSQHR